MKSAEDLIKNFSMLELAEGDFIGDFKNKYSKPIPIEELRNFLNRK